MNQADDPFWTQPPAAPSADDPAFLERLARYLEDGLSPPELAQLERELAEDPHKADAFALVCLGEALAQEEFDRAAEPNPGEDAARTSAPPAERHGSMHDAAVMPALHDEPDALPPFAPRWEGGDRPAPTRRPWWVAVSSIAAALLLLTTLAFWAFRARSPAAPRQARHDGPTSRLVLPLPETVAIVTHTVGADVDLTAGAPVAAHQQLVIQRGCLEVRFTDGAEVIVEAPAELVPESNGVLLLRAGRVAVKVKEGRSGFVVRTPVAAVTDLGTEFGVSAAAGSGATEVHVFKGAVAIGSPGTPSSAGTEKVVAGDLARVDAPGHVAITPGGVNPQLFVRDLGRAATTLELADLLSRGDGTTGLRGGVVDQATGASGTLQTMDAGAWLKGDGKYHRTPSLPTVDGCFIIGAAGAPEQVDSAGHRFTFPDTHPQSSKRIVGGGIVPTLKNGDQVVVRMGGVDYAAPGHSYVYVHPSSGITFDLDAIRRLHPTAQVQRFHCVLGRSSGMQAGDRADAFVLVDGQERFARRRFLTRDGPFTVDLPIAPGERFLTLATTDGGDAVLNKQVLFGDAVLTLAPRR